MQEVQQGAVFLWQVIYTTRPELADSVILAKARSCTNGLLTPASDPNGPITAVCCDTKLGSIPRPSSPAGSDRAPNRNGKERGGQGAGGESTVYEFNFSDNKEMCLLEIVCFFFLRYNCNVNRMDLVCS